MNTFTYVFLTALAITFTLKAWLQYRQINHILKHRDRVPDQFQDKLTLEEHQVAADYSVSHAKLGLFSLCFYTLILLGLTLGGLLNWFDLKVMSLQYNPLWTGIWFVGVLGFFYFLLGLPLDYYETFRIEKRFGFNRQSGQLFALDQIKGLAVSVALGIPFIWLALWLMQESGRLWWLYLWVAFVAFSVLLLWIYPTLIAPFFNKFEPLKDSNLQHRIETLLEQCGFRSNGIFVMDGSTRSTHSNAYFTGLGNSKRIVFYDTLVKNLKPAQIEAVLAHELGHFRLNHIKKLFSLQIVYFLLLFALLGWLYQKPWFFTGLGIRPDTQSTHLALALFYLAIPVFTFIVQPLFSYISRKHEFEADEYASSKRDAKDLIDALLVLYRKDARTVTPDPLHSMIFDSHPPAPIRITQLSQKPAPST